ncbi:MAG: M3 family metallopeptidase, partial [Chloroflexi bacterium]|nr:M3 family metallopeptidase [Chloroflexota bacterium]
YTYMWSLSICKDIFTKFESNGLMDKKTNELYKKSIFEPGTSVDAVTMVNNFLGRDYSLDSFNKWLQGN